MSITPYSLLFVALTAMLAVSPIEPVNVNGNATLEPSFTPATPSEASTRISHVNSAIVLHHSEGMVLESKGNGLVKPEAPTSFQPNKDENPDRNLRIEAGKGHLSEHSPVSMARQFP